MSIIKKIFNSLMQGPFYLIIFGLIFFGIGAGLSYSQSLIERDGTQAPGQVISLVENCDSDGCTFTPLVSFKTREGKAITFRSSYSSSPPAYDVGETVTVIYPADSPEKAIIKDSGMLFRIVFMIVGGLITAIGLGLFSTSVVKIFIKE